MDTITIWLVDVLTGGLFVPNEELTVNELEKLGSLGSVFLFLMSTIVVFLVSFIWVCVVAKKDYNKKHKK